MTTQATTTSSSKKDIIIIGDGGGGGGDSVPTAAAVAAADDDDDDDLINEEEEEQQQDVEKPTNNATATVLAATTTTASELLLSQDEDNHTTASSTTANNTSSSDVPSSTTKDDKKDKKDETDETEEMIPPMSVKPSFGQLLQTAKPEWPMLCLALILMGISEGVNLIIPLIIANAYDTLVSSDEDFTSKEDKQDQINYYMSRALITYAVGTVASFFRSTILGIIGERMVARLRCLLYSSILRQEIAFFDEHKSGELVSRLGNDTTLLQQVISMSIPESIMGIMKVVVSICLMFYLSVKLAGLAVGSVILVFIFAIPLGSYLGILSKSYQDVLGLAQTYSTEAFGQMRTVQAFAAENKETKRFNKRIGNPDDYPYWWPVNLQSGIIVKSTYRVGFFKSLVQSCFFVLIFGGGFGLLYISMWYGFYLVNINEMTLGDLTAFQSYVFTIGFGLGSSSGHIAKILEGLGASGRIFYLLQRIPTIPKPEQDPTKTIKPNKPMIGNVEFNNVKFAYPSRPNVIVLNGYTLKLPANTTTALVGSSGAGKSTAVALLQRFYDISSGSIQIDGNNIQDLNLHWLRRNIGYVQQEPQLFGLSIKENLLYGIDPSSSEEDRGDVSDEEMISACKDANAHDFIIGWPNGYNTLVGERGVKLSGGQKQRIAIARALLTNCRILLLDEATSALDAESEHLVQEAIDNVVVGRTTIIVAHRLSTIQRANQIVVMDNHKIVNIGTHDNLLKECTKYQDLIKRQSMISYDVSFRGLIDDDKTILKHEEEEEEDDNENEDDNDNKNEDDDQKSEEQVA